MTGWRSIALDLTPLRVNRDFRVLFTASLITRIGAMVTYVAAPYQVKELTGSFLAVGAIGALEIVPLVIFGLYGGTIADKVDRRLVAVATEGGFFLCTAALCWNALVDSPNLVLIYVVAMTMAALDGLQRPSLDALVPRLVERVHLPAAAALNSLTGSAAFIMGTALGGVLVVGAGPAAAYGLDALTYAVSGAVLLTLPRVRVAELHDRATIESLRQAARYAASRRDLLGTYLIDTVAMAFAFPNALFPFLAAEIGAPRALGLLYSAGAVGAAVATATSRWTQRVRRHGMAVVLAAAAWGAAIAAAGAAPTLPLVLLCLAVAGAADMISGVFRSLIWNMTIPDDIRGRMAGVELLSYSIGPRLGEVRSSLAAESVGMRRSMISGGLLCTATVCIIARALPTLRRYRADV